MKFFYFVFLMTVLAYFHTFGYLNAHDQNITEVVIVDQTLTPEYLYKIVSPEQWQHSLSQSQIALSSTDKEFIHLATEDQVSNVVKKFWSGKDYIILKITSEKLEGCLIYETNPGGINKYFHLYDGNIPFEAVVEATEFLTN